MKSKLKSGIWAIAVVILSVLVLTFILKPMWQNTETSNFRKKTVTMISDDGVELSADLYEPVSGNKKQKFPGVILLSPFGESREIYSDAAIEICKNDFVVLSVDVRNSGESRLDDKPFVESIANLGLDSDTAVDYMFEQSKVKSDKIAILGTGMTARSALMVTGLNNKIKGAVLVSAVMDSAGYHVIEASPDCPILVMVCIQDIHAAAQALGIYQTSPNPLSKIETYINAGNGSDLWRSYVKFEMISYITNWLNKVLKES